MTLLARLQRRLPSAETLRTHPRLQRFGRHLDCPQLWQLDRRSATRACVVGLFCAWLPLPCQMLLATLGAIVLRAHLPLTLGLVWLNNPFTMLPMFYGAYRVGAWLLPGEPAPFSFALSWEWLAQSLGSVGPGLLLGCLLLGGVSALLGAALVAWCWPAAKPAEHQ